MEQVAIASHYMAIASRYDELDGYQYEKVAEMTVKHLQLQPTDLLVDVGAGTGGITHLLWKKAGLKNPVLCVEPNFEMLQVAVKRDGLIGCNATADEFFASDHQPKYNKIVMCGCAHLFPDILDTFRKAEEYLPQDGQLVLIERGFGYPLWKELRKKFTARVEKDFQELLEQAGFRVQTIKEPYTIRMTKGQWYDKLRGRNLTVLYEFTDEEIQEGLKELDREWFPGKQDSDIIDIKDTMKLSIATK